jgi:uncharacterized membrane protein YphA (DoxX/SURF4 family)
MWTDAIAKNAIAPLILRVVLAVIVFYNGWIKVTGHNNEWGAAWANTKVDRSEAPPEGVLDRLNDWVKWHKQKQAEGQQGEALLPDDIGERMKAAYAAVRSSEIAQLQSSSSGKVQLQSSVQLLVAWGEVIGGVALFVGLLTRFAALGVFIIQVGAIALVTGAQGLSPENPAWWELQLNIALLGMCATLIFLGSGTVALNRLFVPHRRPAAPAPRSEPAPVPATH